MDAVVFCGIQGAGKTTFYQRTFLHTHVRISLDMVKTRRKEAILLHACLATHQSFVVDNTNPKAETRLMYLRLARAAGFTPRLYWFVSDVPGSIERNAARDRRVPVSAIHGTARQLEAPTAEEGWDEILQVRIAADEGGRVVQGGSTRPSREFEIDPVYSNAKRIG